MKIKFLLFVTSVISLMVVTSCNDDDMDGEPLEQINIYEGCCDTAPVVATLDTGFLYIPNVITPNGDGNNDRLDIYYGHGMEIINSYIVRNQENNIVFSNVNINPYFNVDSFFWYGEDMDGNKLFGLFNLEVIITTQLGTTSTFNLKVCSHQCDGVETIDNTTDCAFGSQHNGTGGLDETLPYNEPNCF